MQKCMHCDFRDNPYDSVSVCLASSLNVAEHYRSGQCPLKYFDEPLDKDAKRAAPAIGNRIRRYQLLMAEAIKLLPEYPEARFSGRGIVTCAGAKFMEGAYVLFRVLRHMGYTGPIECWYLKGELYEWHIEALKDLNITLKDASQEQKKYPAIITHPWALKPYAVVNSDFEEVLFLDSDVIPLRKDFLDLFDSAEFKQTGMILFPDRPGITDLQHHKWAAMGLPEGPVQGIESGEIFVDKKRCWKELNLTLWQCEHWKHFMGIYHGDTGAWAFSHYLLGTKFSMPPEQWDWPEGREFGPAMIQKDFNKQPIFAHYTIAKFLLDTYVGEGLFKTGQIADKKCSTIPYNDYCWEVLEELRPIRNKYLAVVQLTANGDILTLLPGLKYLSKDHQITLITCERYADEVKDIPWLGVHVFDGWDSEWQRALKVAEKYGEVRLSQVGHVPLERQQPNWALEEWQRLGMPIDTFYTLPLEIDNRNFIDEQAIIDEHIKGDKPLLLLNTVGNSSPYPYGDRLREFLKKRYGKHFQILDLAFVEAKRFIDLCGLFDKATALISIDTGTLHLGNFNKIPTVALIRDYAPHNGWGCSEKRDHWIETMEYEVSKSDEGMARIAKSIDNLYYLPEVAETIELLPKADLSPLKLPEEIKLEPTPNENGAVVNTNKVKSGCSGCRRGKK